VPVEPDITALVGEHGSGKSHLLGAIARVLTGRGLRAGEVFSPADTCRFSGPVGPHTWPHIGLEFAGEGLEGLFNACGVLDADCETAAVVLGHPERAVLVWDGSAQPVEGLGPLRARLPSLTVIDTEQMLPDRAPLDAPPSLVGMLLRRVLGLTEAGLGEMAAVRDRGFAAACVRQWNHALAERLGLSDHWDTPLAVELDIRDGHVYFDVRDDCGPGPIGDQGAGVQRFISAVIQLRAAPAGVVLIDTPEAGLSMGGQACVLGLLTELAGSGRQIVYTTHAPSMVAADRPRRIRMLQRHGRNITVIADDALLRFAGLQATVSEAATMPPAPRPQVVIQRRSARRLLFELTRIFRAKERAPADLLELDAICMSDAPSGEAVVLGEGGFRLDAVFGPRTRTMEDLVPASIYRTAMVSALGRRLPDPEAFSRACDDALFLMGITAGAEGVFATLGLDSAALYDRSAVLAEVCDLVARRVGALGPRRRYAEDLGLHQLRVNLGRLSSALIACLDGDQRSHTSTSSTPNDSSQAS